MSACGTSRISSASLSRAKSVALVVLTALLCGCGGAQRTRPRAGAEPPPPPERTVAATPERAPLAGPRTPSGDEPAAELESQVVANAAPERPAPAAAETAAAKAMRTDGRPDWWFSHVQTGDGEVARVCAESLGADMIEARRAALEAGRARLRAEFGLNAEAALSGERIERTWVWPLPHGKTGPLRYAGYVLIAADRPAR